jgi:segregation and condensation protein A
MSYIIKTSEFEGPLDVLVSLIEKRKLLINDISLSKVTEGYITYLNSLSIRSIDNLSDFITVASTLLLIKSKSLLPDMDLSYEEELSINELKSRLKQYESLRDQSEKIEKIYGLEPIFLARKPKEEDSRLCIPENLSLDTLRDGTRSVLESLPFFPKKRETRIKPVVSLNEVLERIQSKIGGGFRASFHTFVGEGSQEKDAIIINFIALLELVKQGVLNVEQKKHFQDIMMESKIVATPRYG